MTPAFSQTTGKFNQAGSPQSAVGSFGSLPAEGELILIAFWSWANHYWQPHHCTDNQGNTYSLVESTELLNGIRAALWWAIAGTTSGTFTVTIAQDGGNMWGAGVGLSFSSDLGVGWRPDGVSRNTGNSTTPTTGSTATLRSADQVVAALCAASDAAQASITVDSVSPAWTERAEDLRWVFDAVPGELDTRIVAATTAQSAGWTLASSRQWVSLIASFEPITAGGGGGGLIPVIVHHLKQQGQM